MYNGVLSLEGDFKIHTCSVLNYYFRAEFIDAQIRSILLGGGSKKGLIYTVTISDYLLFIKLITYKLYSLLLFFYFCQPTSHLSQHFALSEK